MAKQKKGVVFAAVGRTERKRKRQKKKRKKKLERRSWWRAHGSEVQVANISS